jgi:hypothetical protein
MIYLEITYAQKDEAKPFGVRWDPKEKLWYFPGDVLPKELERFRPANAPKGAVEKIILDIPFSYRDTAARAGCAPSRLEPFPRHKSALFAIYGSDHGRWSRGVFGRRGRKLARGERHHEDLSQVRLVDHDQNPVRISG